MSYGAMGWLRDSATSLLAKIKTVDGSGSGLDADLLDGHDSSYFAPSGSAITSLTGDVTATGPGAAAATIAAGAFISVNFMCLLCTLPGFAFSTLYLSFNKEP